MSLFSSVKNAVKKVASTVKSVVTAPAKAVSAASNKIVNTVAPKPSVPVNKYPSATGAPSAPPGVATAGGGGTVATASKPVATSFGMQDGQLSGTGLIKNGPGGSGGGSKTSIPSPNTLNTGTKSFTLIGEPLSYTAGNTQMSPSGAGFSASNSGTGIIQHTGGQAMLPGSVSSTTHGGFGMGPGQISGTKLLQGDSQENKGSILGNAFRAVGGAVAKPFQAAYEQFSRTPNPTEQYGATPLTNLVSGAGDAIAGGVESLSRNVVDPLLSAGGAGVNKGIYGITGSDFFNKTASDMWNRAVNGPVGDFDAGSPGDQINVSKFRDAQTKETQIKPGQDARSTQLALTEDTISTLDSIYKINTGAGGEKYIDIQSLLQPTGTDYTVTGPDGQTFTVTEAQYNSNPQYWDSIIGDGYRVTQGTLAADIPPEYQDPEVQQGLQAQYNALQKESGITEAVTQLKDLETQMAAIEMALIKQRDAVMEDPDFSLATKEGRINYIFNNSMEARTYEALTKRAEVLGDFVDRQNEQIKTQLGFANQDIQNQLAYQQANAPQNRQTQVVEINGQQVLIDSQTGQPISNLGAKGDGQVDITKDARYQNYQARETQWNNVVGTVSRFAPQGFNPSNQNAWNTVDWKAMANNKPAVDAIANAVIRMANPDITRAAAGGDPYASESILNQARQLVGQWFQDQNALPEKLQEAVGQAITYWNNSKQELAQAQSSGRTYASDSQDNTAFISAAKAAGYTDAQIQEYLTQQSAFNW